MTSQMLVKADEPKTNTIKGQLKLLDVFGSQNPRPTYKCSVDLIEFNNKTTPKEYRHLLGWAQGDPNMLSKLNG